jgi:hypothetical protein
VEGCAEHECATHDDYHDCYSRQHQIDNQLHGKQHGWMQWCSRNPPQPTDLTVSDQRVRQGSRDPYQADDQEGWDPQIDDRQAGSANITWHGVSDKPEHSQQDCWKSNARQNAVWLSPGEPGLDLEQLGEATARPVTRRRCDV